MLGRGCRRAPAWQYQIIVVVWMWVLAAGCGDADRAARTAPSPDAAADATADATADVDAGLSDAASDAVDIADAGADSDAGADPAPLGPPYPIVLAHGMFGFEHLADLDFVPYWYDLPETLEAAGEVVYVTEVDPLNDSYDRGEQLLEQVEAIVKDSGYAKVNLIGHSQGGLDIRYVAHERPDLVASAVCIGTPNHGTPVSDIVLKLVANDRFQELVDAVVRIVGKPLYDEVGNETSLFDSLRQFSTPGIEEFNQQITDQPGVYYASVAGRTDNSSGGLNCTANDAPDFIKKWDYYDDPVDPILAIPEAIVDGGPLHNRPNDGLVLVTDAMWGDFLGCIPADHLDEVGQLLGDDPGGQNAFDHLEFYGDLVAYLHAQGL